MQPEAPSQDVRGVALLMRRGMAAWMRCVGEPGPRAPACSATSSPAGQRPSTIQQMLVNIVAAMALPNVAQEINA